MLPKETIENRSPRVISVPSPRTSTTPIFTPKVISVPSPRISTILSNSPKVISVHSPRISTTSISTPKVIAIPSPRLVQSSTPLIMSQRILPTKKTIPLSPKLIMPRFPDGEPWEALDISNEESYRLFKEDWINNNSGYDFYYIDNSAIEKYNTVYALGPNLFGPHVNIKKQEYLIEGQLKTQRINYDLVCLIGPVIAYYDEIRSIENCSQDVFNNITFEQTTKQSTSSVQQVIDNYKPYVPYYDLNYERYISQGLKIPPFAIRIHQN